VVDTLAGVFGVDILAVCGCVFGLEVLMLGVGWEWKGREVGEMKAYVVGKERSKWVHVCTSVM
jgi:hypothetical protein